MTVLMGSAGNSNCIFTFIRKQVDRKQTIITIAERVLEYQKENSVLRTNF